MTSGVAQSFAFQKLCVFFAQSQHKLQSYKNSSALPCFRLWHRCFYDPNVWNPKKRDEKLSYMHNDLLKTRLDAGGWEWSSWKFYFLDDASILSMDRMPE